MFSDNSITAQDDIIPTIDHPIPLTLSTLIDHLKIRVTDGKRVYSVLNYKYNKDTLEITISNERANLEDHIPQKYDVFLTNSLENAATLRRNLRKIFHEP